MFAGTPPQLTDQLEIRVRAGPRVLSNTQPPAISRACKEKEMTMFALTEISRTTQQYVCMALSALIVTTSLSLGALMAEAAAHADYTVTITQLA